METLKLNKDTTYTKSINRIETAENIKKIRIEKGITTYRIADELKTSRSYYSQLENGKKPITEKFLSKLAAFYHIPIEKIVIYDKDYNAGYIDCFNEHFSDWYNDMLSINYCLDKQAHGMPSGSLKLLLREMGYKVIHISGKEAHNMFCDKNSFLRYENVDNETAFRGLKSILGEDFSQSSFLIINTIKNKNVCFWSLADYHMFEKMVFSSIRGYIDHIAKEFKNTFGLLEANNITEKDVPSFLHNMLTNPFRKNPPIEQFDENIRILRERINKLEKTYKEVKKFAKSQRDGDDL